MLMRTRCVRWRTLAGLLLILVVSLNFFVFLTLPSGKNQVYDTGPDNQASLIAAGSAQRAFDSRIISHLHAPRKRLNKSNFTSDSLGVEGGEGGRGGGGRRGGIKKEGGKGPDAGLGDGGAAWEEGVGDHPPPLIVPGGSRFVDSRGVHGDVVEGPGADSLPKQAPAERPLPVDNAINKVDKYPDDRDKKSGGIAVQEAPMKQMPLLDHRTSKPIFTEQTFSRANFTDPRVDELVTVLVGKGLLDILPGQKLEDEHYWMFLKRQRLRRKAGIQLPSYKNYKSATNWERFHTGIRQHYLYDPDSPVVDRLMKDLARKTIIDAEQKEGGTQLKLIMTFDDEGQALLKPMRFPRDTQTQPDHFYFADFERHIAEIAAFHLDRVLGYNRVPPVTGRIINMTRDIRQLTDSKLARTFFISPAGNLCFHGSCSYYCDSGHPICGHPDMIESSMMAFLPPERMAHRQTWRNPWKRSYSKHRKAYWEVYDDLCDKVKKRAPYNSGRRLLDIIDMSVMDFLMGNLDRHHYETFRAFGNDSIILHLDHGRGFGKFYEDELSCLAPLLQCCMIRLSTLQRLVRLYHGPHSLGDLMNVTLTSDPIAPVLVDPQLTALDRRLAKVLREIADCLQQPYISLENGVEVERTRTINDVIVDDGVY